MNISRSAPGWGARWLGHSKHTLLCLGWFCIHRAPSVSSRPAPLPLGAPCISSPSAVSPENMRDAKKRADFVNPCWPNEATFTDKGAAFTTSSRPPTPKGHGRCDGRSTPKVGGRVRLPFRQVPYHAIPATNACRRGRGLHSIADTQQNFTPHAAMPRRPLRPAILLQGTGRGYLRSMKNAILAALWPTVPGRWGCDGRRKKA